MDLLIPSTTIGRIIIALIFACWAYGMANVIIRLIKLLGFERPNLSGVQDNYRRPMSIQSDDLEKIKDHLQQDISPDSIAHRRIEHISQIKSIGGEVNQDAISDVLLGKLSTMAGFSRHLAGILIILGLIGTLAGLLIAIDEIQPLITPENITQVDQLSQAIGNTLKGMKTAFSTTFAGLVATLILGATIFLLDRQQTRFLIDIEEFTTNALLPVFSPTGVNIIVDASRALEKSSGAMELAARKLTDASWETQIDQAVLISESFAKATSALTERLDKLGELQYNIEQILNEFSAETQAARKSYADSTQVLSTAISEGNAKLVERFAEILEQVQKR